jgi:hypothetical protein
MEHLKTTANFKSPDDIYDILIHAHDGLTKPQSDSLNARLILILLNHIGDEKIIAEALQMARLAAV